MILPLAHHSPVLGQEVFIAPDAWVIGDVTVSDQASIFFGSVLRGDILPIVIGRESNLQERVLVHTSHGRTPTIVGEQVTVGHGAILHGCRIGNRCLVGMGAILLDEVVIEDECVIAAGTVIPVGKKFPARSMIMGIPGKVVRPLNQPEIDFFRVSAERYVKVGKSYREIFGNILGTGIN